MQFIVTVPDICKQSGCLIQVTLQWLKNSTVPTDLTLYTEKSQTFKIDKNIFYRLYSIMIGYKSLLALNQMNDALFCSRCQCFNANIVSYLNTYIIFAHFC